MRRDPIFTSWLVRCSSPEEARRLQGWLLDHIALDALVENVVRAYPDGVEMQRVEQHRLGDYFEEVRMLPGPPDNPSAFRLLFHRRSNAGRFWKDVMARIVGSLQNASADATITLDYRGEEEPTVATLSR